MPLLGSPGPRRSGVILCQAVSPAAQRGHMGHREAAGLWEKTRSRRPLHTPPQMPTHRHPLAPPALEWELRAPRYQRTVGSSSSGKVLTLQAFLNAMPEHSGTGGSEILPQGVLGPGWLPAPTEAEADPGSYRGS